MNKTSNPVKKKKGILSRGTWKNILDLDENEFPQLTNQKVKLFAGNSNLALAREIGNYLDKPLSKADVSRFSNGEIRVKIEESVRGNDVFLIQSMNEPVNDNLMELLILCDAVARASATSITMVIPYFGYAKQEKKTAGREPITAKLVANLMTVAGATRIITMDLHAAAIQGFFEFPVDNLYAFPLFEHLYKKRGLTGEKVVIVSPDAGGVARAREFADRLNTSMAIIFKRRPKPDVAEVIEFVGEVEGKTAILIDDMISTGGTITKAAEMTMKMGAKEVYACATHAILAKDAVQKINDSPIKQVAVTNTIPLPKDKDTSRFVQLSVAPMFGEAIRRNFFDLSVSKIFV